MRPSEVLWAALQAGELEGAPPAVPRDRPLRLRVGSLAALASGVAAAPAEAIAEFHLLRREFLDDWQVLRDDEERLAAVAADPALVEPRVDAYLAALAEHLTTQAGLAPPRWVLEPSRFLAAWWWPGNTRALDAVALRDSPAAFRRRGIFIGATTLVRV